MESDLGLGFLLVPRLGMQGAVSNRVSLVAFCVVIQQYECSCSFLFREISFVRALFYYKHRLGLFTALRIFNERFFTSPHLRVRDLRVFRKFQDMNLQILQYCISLWSLVQRIHVLYNVQK